MDFVPHDSRRGGETLSRFFGTVICGLGSFEHHVEGRLRGSSNAREAA